MGSVQAPFAGHPLEDIQGYVVIASENSTHGGEAATYAATLQSQECQREVAVVRTNSDEGANRERLFQALQAGNVLQKLIIVGGGDGSAHYAVRALLHPDMPAAFQDSPLTSWPLGNGNDFCFAIHDKRTAGHPPSIVNHPGAHIIKVHPLEVTDGEGELVDYALLYATIGPTAAAAKILNSEEHRDKKARHNERVGMAIDIASAIQTLWRPERYQVEIGSRIMAMAEIQCVNADRMAILARYPTCLSRHEMHVGFITQTNPFAVGATIVRLLVGKPRGQRHNHPLTFTIANDETVPLEIDGECSDLKAGETRTIQPSTRHIRVWATKKNA